MGIDGFIDRPDIFWIGSCDAVHILPGGVDGQDQLPGGVATMDGLTIRSEYGALCVRLTIYRPGVHIASMDDVDLVVCRMDSEVQDMG